MTRCRAARAPVGSSPSQHEWAALLLGANAATMAQGYSRRQLAEATRWEEVRPLGRRRRAVPRPARAAGDGRWAVRPLGRREPAVPRPRHGPPDGPCAPVVVVPFASRDVPGCR
ncbi:hypothetical protein [Streptomyces sp. NPDC047706]|uniref:hypothetical protein n=1 Tax=Streptomyces sp. NPDC047706 TaxID=3365486 RepID=UPI0037141395